VLCRQTGCVKGRGGGVERLDDAPDAQRTASRHELNVRGDQLTKTIGEAAHLYGRTRLDSGDVGGRDAGIENGRGGDEYRLTEHHERLSRDLHLIERTRAIPPERHLAGQPGRPVRVT